MSRNNSSNSGSNPSNSENSSNNPIDSNSDSSPNLFGFNNNNNNNNNSVFHSFTPATALVNNLFGFNNINHTGPTAAPHSNTFAPVPFAAQPNTAVPFSDYFAAQSNTPVPFTAQSNTSAPVTAQPNTPVSVTAQPNTPVPVTAQPNTPVSVTAQYNTPVSVTAQSNTPAPVTAQYNTPVPVTAQSNTAQPNTPVPVTDYFAAQSNTPAPVTAQYNTPVPVTAQYNTPVPVTAQPNTPVSVTAQPNTPVSVTAQPNTPVPVTAQPNTPVSVTAQYNTPVSVTAQYNTPVPVTAQSNTPVPVTAQYNTLATTPVTTLDTTTVTTPITTPVTTLDTTTVTTVTTPVTNSQTVPIDLISSVVPSVYSNTNNDSFIPVTVVNNNVDINTQSNTYTSILANSINTSQYFVDQDTIKTYIRDLANELKEDVSIFNSDNSRIKFRCLFGGKFRNTTGINPEEHVRRSSTRLFECPFRITARKSRMGWHVVITQPTHNHPVGENVLPFPPQQKLTDMEKKIIDDLTDAGCNPRQISTSLRNEFSERPLAARSIYNYRQKSKRLELNGKTEIQYLYENLLHNNKWNSKIDTNDDNQVNHLYLSYKKSIKKLKINHEVLLGDCTYKTNRYGMPLLVIIGISATNKTFIVSFCFMRSENQADYEWALNCLQDDLGEGNYPQVFCTDKDRAFTNALYNQWPHIKHLLCAWHVNKSILAKCKPLLKEQWEQFNTEWSRVMYAETDELFTEQWDEFKTKWVRETEALCYIEDNWIPLKHKWAKGYTDYIRHYGSSSTSRVEGTHATIKRFIQVSTYTLYTAFNELEHVMEQQTEKDSLEIQRQSMTKCHRLQKKIFSEIENKISLFAALKILDEYRVVINYLLKGFEVWSCIYGQRHNTFYLCNDLK